ncbi:hypothetical protein KTR66_08030 [Roseococcus sp. SDR]|uniref:hypothetical protein n=1 Tax=Roseococcus sp. SDR TaxID=2835532 RepID=UPI001BCCC084|nr:hypothetical protein [Roseococcus sp. SDR]MBS7789938.1 hypothetical protein [Roseococcus sp. SDR]MBV1845252.1 hypothetical protein [Roseococcus sp. SDR]
MGPIAPLDRARRVVFPERMIRVAPLLLLLASACAPPATLRQPVIGASYEPVNAPLPPLPAVMELTGDPPIALPDPSTFTPILAPRSGPGGRP